MVASLTMRKILGTMRKRHSSYSGNTASTSINTSSPNNTVLEGELPPPCLTLTSSMLASDSNPTHNRTHSSWHYTPVAPNRSKHNETTK